MNHIELAEKLINPPYIGEHEIRIRLKQPGVAVTSSVGVEYVWQGIDWDNKKLFLEPTEPLVSWKYIERYVPDIHEQIEKAKQKRI